MYNEPRNWKWMTPAAVAALCVWALENGWWPTPFTALGWICGLAAVVNLYLYIQGHVAGERVAMVQARNSTPQVRLFEAARSMHPDAVRWLMLQQRIVWRMKYVPKENYVDWILDEAPGVHVGFLRFVLENSTNTSMMPKRLLTDGSKKFDPEGLLTDREQWDLLKNLMVSKLMCSEALGNQSPMWLPPYTPSMLMTRFGIVNSDEAEESDAAMERTVERAGGWKAGEATPTPLSASTQTSPQTSTFRGRKVEEPVLSDEELRRLEEIQAAYQYK